MLTTLAAGAPRAQSGTSGTVAEIANPIRIRMDDGAAAPIGSTVYALRAAGGVGVLTGTYTVVRQAGEDVFAEPSGPGEGTAVGNRVEVAGATLPSFVRIQSDPAGASVARGGYPLGTTPLRVEVAAGEHAFVLSAAGYDPTTLTLQVPEAQILSVVQSLSRPRPATNLFIEAEVAFVAARYDDAARLLAQAALNGDASLTAAQAARLPSLAFAAGLGAGIAARGAARGMTPAQTADAVSKIAFVHTRRAEPAITSGVMVDLEAALPNDPALASVRSLLTP